MLALNTRGCAQAGADVLVFDADHAASVGDYDASVPSVSEPGALTLAGTPFSGKLPIVSNSAFIDQRSGLPEWKSAPRRQVMEPSCEFAHEHGPAVLVVTYDHCALDAFDRSVERKDGELRALRTA